MTYIVKDVVFTAKVSDKPLYVIWENPILFINFSPPAFQIGKLAKIYLYGPQFLGQSTTPALHRFLQQKYSRLSFRLYFCGPDFYTCLSKQIQYFVVQSFTLVYLKDNMTCFQRFTHLFKWHKYWSQTRGWQNPRMWSRVRLG